MSESVMNEKRKALLVYKQKLLNDVKYFNSRIKEARSKSSRNVDFDGESSDSDVDMTANIDLGPNVTELKQLQFQLKTCLQATKELTGVHVLESQVEVVVQDPVVDGKPITEDGIWYEVVAECKLDLVQFLITFFVHKSNRKFGPTHYRGLKVNAVKKAHEMELSPALTDLDSPGNAIMLIGEFASCHRARRSSLAQLADKFAGALLMAPRSEGGFTLKCLDVLDMWWTIKYSRSKGAFNHSLKFDIDHMDDKHLQIIKQYYQQLDPSIGTDKRTFLLEKILHTCIESKGTTIEMYESTESDQEMIERQQYYEKLLNNHDIVTKKRVNKQIGNKDSEIMAPPKALPKKTKPKGKENKIGNDTDKSVKRSIENSEEVSNKKPKKDTKAVEKVASNKVVSEKDNNVAVNENKTQETTDKNHKSKEKDNHQVDTQKVVKKTTSKEKTVNKEAKAVKTSTNTEKQSKTTTSKDKEPNKMENNDLKQKNGTEKTVETTNKVDKTKPPKTDHQKKVDNVKTSVASKKSDNVATIKPKDVIPKQKTIKNNNNKKKNIQDRVSTVGKIFEKRTVNPKAATNATASQKKTETSRKSIGKVIKRKSTKGIRRGTFTVVNNKPSPKNNIPTIPPKTVLAKKLDIGRDLTGNSLTSNGDRVSKIPQKTSSFSSVGQQRISPRKLVQMKPKTFNTANSRPAQKKPTNIPRLLKKPDQKNMT